MKVLYNHNGLTGKLDIYSSHSDELILETVIPVGEGDLDRAHQLVRAIRNAERIAYRAGIAKVQQIVYSASEQS